MIGAANLPYQVWLVKVDQAVKVVVIHIICPKGPIQQSLQEFNEFIEFGEFLAVIDDKFYPKLALIGGQSTH